MAVPVRQHPWLAAAAVTGLNTYVQLYNRYVSKEDFAQTTMGGIAIGEITHRVSDIVLDDRQRGFNRFLREAAAFVINPMKGVARIV